MAENITGFQTKDGVALVDYDYLANKPVTRIVSDSADTAPVLRTLESGSYVLQGKFRAYTGATSVLGFSSALMVNVIKGTSKSSVQIFYPVNNCVQFLEITDEAMTKTFVYLNQVLEHIGTMKDLNTEEKTSLVAAINELVDMVSSMSGGTGGGITEETDPTVPEWAKQPTKPTYTAEDVGAAEKDHNHDEKYQPKGNYAAEGHDHDGKYQPVGNYLTEESDPTVPSWAKQPTKPTYTADEVNARPNTWMPTAEDVGARPSTWTPTASDVGADASGTAASKVTEHNAATDSHNDIRLLIQGLDARLTALADSDDTTLDQLSELVAYIKANRGLIESITTDKVNVADIINNLTTNATNKPLSAAQGVALKSLIDALTTTVDGKQTAEQVATAISNALKAYPTTTAMQTAISTALADYAKADHNHDGTYQPAGDYASGDHNHDGVYQPKGDYAAEGHNHDDTYAAKEHDHAGVYQPAGSYAASDHNHDGTYAKPADIPTVPSALPNPYALTILGKTYTGGKAVSLTAEEIMEAIKAASGGVVAYLDGSKLVMTGNLPDATYTAYYEVENDDGTKSLVEIGELTLGEEETTEPDPVTYTVTFVADGVTVETVTYEAGATSIEEPTVPVKDGYTGVWESYTLNDTNITVNAVYTAIETEEPEPVTENITLTKDVSIVTGTGADRASSTAYCATPHIDVSGIPKPCTIHLTGARWTFTNASDTGYIRFYIANTSGTKLASDYTHSSKMPSGVTLATNDGDETDVTVTITSDNIGTVRFAGHYTYGNLGNTNVNMTQTQATLTYTPTS